ncbi:hypothetical protein HK57_00595 [Aspergillus ustus]|uniref:Uncharacterized protein n=1 Tax=Aspergillus ustus TaxID=40382 RepID=A0A0C1E2A3_ASPUT|nr:hypothetical protein HK57_00595 [Aspergillus ustus]
MHLLARCTLLLVLTAHSVLATIALGALELQENKPLLNIAWIEGTDPCTRYEFTQISANGQNPCGIRFKLANGYTYYEENCGAGAIVIRNDDGSFNSQCKQKNWSCPEGSITIRQTWTCS